MSRGTYTVYKPQRPDSKQDSWRSCTCSVIIFAVICILILLVAWPLKYTNAENGRGKNKENIEGYSAAYVENKLDAEVIPVNNTDNNKTAKVIIQTPLSTTESEKEDATTVFHKVHFVSTTPFNNFEESTQKSITTHPSSIETETIKTTSGDFNGGTLSESKPTTETPTEREKIISQTIKTILLENELISETHTERGETLTTHKTHKSIQSVGTEETHSHQDSITTNSSEKYTSSSGSTLHSESTVTKDLTEKGSTGTLLDLLKYNYESTTQKPDDITTQNSFNTTMSSSAQIATTEPVIPTEHSNIESSSSSTQNNKHITSSILPPTTLSQNDTTDNVISVSRTFNNYNIETTSTKSNSLENSTLSTPLSSVKGTTDKILEHVETKLTETTISYQPPSTTPYAPSKTTTELSQFKFPPHQDITHEEETNVCDSNTCKNIASKSLSFMKHDENICEDFYSYACGGISKDYLVERDPSADFLKRLKDTIENTGDDSSEYAIAFKNYFTSCMNYDYSKVKALDPAQKALTDVGFFCDKNTKFPPLTHLLTVLLKKNFPVLFDVRMDVDPHTKNLSLVILPVFPDLKYESLTRNNENEKFLIDKTMFRKGELNLTAAYLIHNDSQNDVSRYMLEVRQALESFNVFDGKLGNNLLSEVLIFLELTILDAQRQFLPTAIKRRKEFQYNIFVYKSLPILQKSLNVVNWEELLTSLVGRPLPKDIHIQVYFMSYLSQVLNALKTTDEREMHNSILALYTHHLYKQYVLDQKKIGDRTSYCLKMSSKQMQDVSSALYLESFEKSKITNLYKHAENIFERLVNTLYSELNKDWLSENKNQQFAKETIQNLTLLSIGDHLPWKNPQDLVRRLDEYDVNITCFIVNTNALQERNRKLLYKQLGTDPMIPENMWTILFSPFDIKLSILKSLSRIVLPLGALSYHLDNPAYPKYVSMADLGFNIAKQINLYLELSSIKILKKNDGAQLENQLLQIKPANDETPMFVEINPSDLSTEIITDVAGAKLAYMAYKNYGSEILSNDLPVIWANKTTGQLYFLLLAQQFCTKRSVSDDLLGLFEGAQLPPLIAMNSIAVNTDEFYDLNGCTGETTMTAAIKILLPSVASTTEMDPMDFSQ